MSTKKEEKSGDQGGLIYQNLRKLINIVVSFFKIDLKLSIG